jgi:hypothetical protein
VPTYESVKKVLRDLRRNPLHTLLLLIMLGIGVGVGSFLVSAGSYFGKRGAQITFQVLESGTIARLAPSRITNLSYRVAVLNATTSLSDGEVRAVVKALQTQVQRDFAPVWGIGAGLTVVSKGMRPPDNAWQLVLLDHADQAGAIGYHDVTSEGLPLAKVFVATARESNLSWTVSASHELLNLLANPRINLTVFVQRPGTKGTLYSYEVTDPCEDDKYAYSIGDTRVSDFVTPAWFEEWRKPQSARFDQNGHINKPFELLPGGYAMVFEVGVGEWRPLQFGSNAN